MAGVWIDLNNTTPPPSAGNENVVFQFEDFPGGAPEGATLRKVSAQVPAGSGTSRAISVNGAGVSDDFYVTVNRTKPILVNGA